MEPLKDKELKTRLSAAIFLSIDLEANFKLYSYRILEPEIFVERLEELVSRYREIAKQAKKDYEENTQEVVVQWATQEDYM